MLPPLNGHRREPQVGAVDPELRPPVPSAGGMARRPHSGGPPASIGGRACSCPRSPPCCLPSGTKAPSRPAEPEQPPRGPGIDAPQRRVLLVDGWDNEAEGSGGH